MSVRRIARSTHLLRARWRHLTRHPLTRDRPLSAVGRYLRFHLSQTVRPRLIEVPFVDGTHLLARRGVGGATDHLYVHLGDVEEMALLHHLLRPGDRFVDVGANVGSYSVLAAAAGADVIACEPGEALDLLRRVVAENGLTDRCRVEPVAVGATDGTVRLTEGRDSLNRVVPDQPGQTRLVTIDTLCRDHPPLAMKLDVEGYELAVLEGAGQTFARPETKVLVIELNGGGRAFGTSDADVHATVTELGFRPHRYDPVDRGLLATDSWNRDRFNTIYVRDLPFVTERLREAAPLTVGPHVL